MSTDRVIRIARKLHPGISGATRHWDVMATFKFGPRNGFRAYQSLLSTLADNREMYGNIGCGLTRAFIGDVDATDELRMMGDQAVDHGRRTLDCEWLLGIVTYNDASPEPATVE